MIRFRTEFPIQPINPKINYKSSVLLSGSCFSEHISAKLSDLKFNLSANPSGIIYNPISLAAEIERYIRDQLVAETELFTTNGIYRHYDFHSRFASTGSSQSLQAMNDAVNASHSFLRTATHLIITFGTAICYRLRSSGRIVANNHKQPLQLFDKLTLEPDDIATRWSETIAELRNFNPGIKIIFTVSPVRHIKDGVVENQLSKSILIAAVHKLIGTYSDITYFPAYELMMDDLRDYRFYTADLIHPNEQAIDYIFEKFKDACIDASCFTLMDELAAITSAMRHKPFFPGSEDHLKFKRSMLEKLNILSRQYPEMDFQNELRYFSALAK